jgi:hexosaminidase
VKVKFNKGSFEIKNHTAVFCKSEDLVGVDKYLGKQLGGLDVKNGTGRGINLLIADEEVKGLGTEGYKLNITASRIEIVANKPNGIFYGVQTLLQMLPPIMMNSSKQNYSLCEVRCAEIEDFPRFQWRGLLFLSQIWKNV